jgi:glycosyltransferase involved in cell wall biosynthesis
MRLAWFTPWPPQPSGVAGRSGELVRELAARGHAIDVFVDEHDARVAPLLRPTPASAPEAGSVRVQSAHDFVWRAAQGQYDLPVYQMGNSLLHEFIWPYLFRWPGLVALHDARLHHARGRALLRRGRAADYRTEFAWNHPAASPDLAELAVCGFDGPYYYEWPMVRTVIESARLTVSHSRGAAAQLSEMFPERPVEYVALGEGYFDDDVDSARLAFRSAHKIDASAVVFGVHGALTTEKRVPQILRAFAATRAWLGDARLLLAGRLDPALRLPQQIEALELSDVTHVIESLDDSGFDHAIAATDVSLNLRWPTSLETSGPWLRSLSLGRATAIVDLVHQRDVPVLDPRTWRRHAPCEDLSTDADARAVAVAIDVLDEDHSLKLAFRRLATDRALREQLGRNARAYWLREHTVARMADDYERAIATARDREPPSLPLPRHLRPDPAAFTGRLLESFDLSPDI